jgi:hypothetical protein
MMTMQINKTNTIDDCHRVIAQAVVRRIAHKFLNKYASISPPDQVENALKHHTLPEDLQLELLERYGGGKPRTWYDALQQLKQKSASSSDDDPSSELWRLILDHPMTSYVPVQCQSCGHVVPDDSSPSKLSDADVGLSEEEPTSQELELRGGWFRGPRLPKIFRLECPNCHAVSRWYRSGHPQVILNPHRWGRLCGEQEDLRLNLANYLQTPVRMCLPLDWDHVWSEFLVGGRGDNDNNHNHNHNQWEVSDGSARNFAVRLNEGIGAWTGVWAIHPDPELCGDVTNEYLSCQQQGGRSENTHATNMGQYREVVEAARTDPTADATQAKTLNGFVLQRAKHYFTNDDIVTTELRRAAKEYGKREWWQVE